MKHLPKSTLTEILNDPYGFTYKEMSEVIGEDKARALYAELYKQPFHKKNLSKQQLYSCVYNKHKSPPPKNGLMWLDKANYINPLYTVPQFFPLHSFEMMQKIARSSYLFFR